MVPSRASPNPRPRSVHAGCNGTSTPSGSGPTERKVPGIQPGCGRCGASWSRICRAAPTSTTSPRMISRKKSAPLSARTTSGCVRSRRCMTRPISSGSIPTLRPPSRHAVRTDHRFAEVPQTADAIRAARKTASCSNRHYCPFGSAGNSLKRSMVSQRGAVLVGRRQERNLMKTQSIAVSVIALLAFGLPAAAQDYKVSGQFGWFGIGKAAELEKDHVFWVGEFSGTFFNDKGANSLFDHSGVRCPGSYDLNFGKKQGHANGYCIIMGEGSASDQAFLKWSCDGDTVDCSGTFEYTGGT